MTAPASFHTLRFDRAAARYEAGARVQAHMAEVLLDLWGDRPEPSRVLECGCGTGLLTRALRARFPGAALAATDASPAMVEIARRTEGLESVTFGILDARGVPDAEPSPRREPPGPPSALLAAGALVQWFPDLAGHFHFAHALSAPGAHYLVSGFDRDNFPELNALLTEPPFSYRNFPGHTPQAVEAAAGAAGWDVAALLAWEDVEVLPSARAVLQRVQDLGAARDPREGGRMTRANLAHLLKEYEQRFAVEGGVRLTWKPWAALLRKL